MSRSISRKLLEQQYEEEAQRYLHSLPLEHYMEAVQQATQRKISVESFDLIHDLWRDFQAFNELLVQYRRPRRKKPGHVLPDNMVVVHDEPIQAEGSYNVPLQPVPPYLVLEYVSKNSKRKDYEDNMEKYEHELKVPYYLIFYPDNQEMTLYQHDGKRYVSVKPNEQGRLPIAQLELELGLLDGWVRYWFRGKLVPLTPDLQHEVNELQAKLKKAEERADQAEQRASQAEERAARLERELRQLRANQANGQQPPENV